MGIKRSIYSIADKFTNRVDEKLILYVSKFINDDMNVLEKAVSIYLCLGDVLVYSPRFCLTHDYSKLNMVRDINLDNNEMICKSWSILYYRLLKYFGIKSKVVRYKSHYNVEMDFDGAIYSIDATSYGGNNIYYSMSDISRIKFGFKIERFLVASAIDPYDINKFTHALEELDVAINNVYARQKRKVVSDDKIIKLRLRVSDAIQFHSRKVGIGSLDDINYRIRMINRFWNLNLDDSSIERVQLFNAFFKTVFGDLEDYGYEAKCYNVYAYDNHKLKAYKLIAIDIDCDYHYIMDDGNKFVYYSKKQVIDEFYKRKMRITEFTEVLGIYTGLEMFKVRMK